VLNSSSKVLVICGPTSSGKTALALRLAGSKSVSLVSADSRQIYRGLSLLTGKDIPAGFVKKESELSFNDRKVIYFEKENLRLWGFDLLLPDEIFNAADFSDLTRKILSREQQEGRMVLVVGGTGFYLKALTEPSSLAKVKPDEVLRQKLNRLSVEELQKELKKIDPERLSLMNESDVANPRRLIRAIEVAQTPVLSAKASPTSEFEFIWVGLQLPLEQIKEKIAARVDDRLATAVSEVGALLTGYPDRSLPIYTSLGAKPILRFLTGEISPDEMRQIWITDEVNYAKRQLTWFKKQNQIIWYDENKARQIKLDQLL